LENHLLAQVPPTTVALLAIAGIGLLILMVVAIVLLSYFRWWVQAFFAKAKISYFDLIGMSFRKVKPSIIVPAKIMATQAGLNDPDTDCSQQS